jgi:DNA-binding transcriptional ArsR family regulator
MEKNTKSLELEINLLHERVCSALADTKRIMILYLLAEKEMFVNEISDALDTPQSTISRHLRVLRERNLVATKRQGTAVLYSLPDDRIIQVLDLMRAILNDQIQAEAAITRSV